MARQVGISVVQHGDVLVVAGAIDDTCALLDLLPYARQRRLVMDLAGITFINSLGLRNWIRLQNAAQRAGVMVELHRVAEPLIQQMNMIITARGHARVVSFFAPYACDACGREASLLIDAVTHAQGLARLEPPAIVCAECGAMMVFNDFPERYFSFLSV